MTAAIHAGPAHILEGGQRPLGLGNRSRRRAGPTTFGEWNRVTVNCYHTQPNLLLSSGWAPHPRHEGWNIDDIV